MNNLRPNKRHSLRIALYAAALLALQVAGAPAQHFGFAAAGRLNAHFNSDAGNDEEPALATDGAGVWVAAWQSADDLGATIGTDYDILFSRSTDNGSTWSAPTALNSYAATDGGSDNDFTANLATDGAGNWVAVWMSNETLGGTAGTDFDILYSRSTDNGATWSAAGVLHASYGLADSASDFYPYLASDGADDFMVAWETDFAVSPGLGPDAEIVGILSSDDGATWGAPFVVSSLSATDSGFEDRVVLDSGGPGTDIWVAAWRSRETLGGTIGGDQDIMFARTANGGSSWSAAAPLNPNAATDPSIGGDERFVALASDGAGTWVAAWDSPDPNAAPGVGSEGDIYCTRSTDDGVTWSPTMTLLNVSDATSDTGVDEDARVVYDPSASEWAIIWSSPRASGFELRLSRSTDGGATWSADGIVNSTTGGGAELEPVLGVGMNGRWVAAWESYDDLAGGSQGEGDIHFAASAALPVELSGFALE